MRCHLTCSSSQAVKREIKVNFLVTEVCSICNVVSVDMVAILTPSYTPWVIIYLLCDYNWHPMRKNSRCESAGQQAFHRHEVFGEQKCTGLHCNRLEIVRSFSWYNFAKIMRSFGQLYHVSLGLVYLHSKKIVHGDLKGVMNLCFFTGSCHTWIHPAEYSHRWC